MAEVGSAFVSILPSAKGFGRSLEGQVGGEVSGVGKSTGSKYGAAFKVGALAAIGGAFAAGKFLTSAIGSASDLNESTTKIEAIFGDAAKAVQSFSDGGAKALGQTKLDVLSSAATFGTFGKAAGLAGGDLAKFSTDFVGLSTDLASFNNTTPEQAVEAIGAALRGESEPLRQYGVLLDDATLRNEALKLGLIETTSEALTPANKVLAAQAAIYKQTKDAQGDFEKTSGGLANQQRILSASFSDIRTKLGTSLLPLATKFFSYLNDKAIPAIATAGDFLSSRLGPAIESAADFLGNLTGSLGGATDILTTFGPAIASAVVTVGVLVGALKLWAIAQTAINFLLAANPIGLVVIAIAALVGGIVYAYQHSEVFRSVLAQVGAVIRDQVFPIVQSFGRYVVDTLIPAVISTAQAVGSRLKPIFDQLVATFRAKVLPSLQLILAKFREWQPTIQRVIEVVAKVIGKNLEFAAAILGKVLPPVIKFAGLLLGTLVPVILNSIEVTARIIGKVIEFGKTVVDRVKDVAKFVSGLKDKFNEAVQFVSGIPGRILSAIGDLGGLLVNAGQELIGGLISGISSKIGELTSKLKSVTDLIPKFKGPLKKDKVLLRPAGLAIMGGLIDAIEDRKSELGKALSKITDQIGDKFRNLLAEAKSFANSVADAFRPDLLGGSLADLFTVGTESIAELKATKRALAELQDVKGISKAFLSGLEQSGNAGLILDLAQGSNKGVRAASSIFDKTNSLSDRIGKNASRDLYGNKLDGLRDELRGVNKRLDRLASQVGREVNGAAANGRRRATA